MSRNSQPLATIPCSWGGRPVKMVAWAVHVTAGTTSWSERAQPRSASCRSRGASGSSFRVSPTALIRTSGCSSIRRSVSCCLLNRPNRSHLTRTSPGDLGRIRPVRRRPIRSACAAKVAGPLTSSSDWFVRRFHRGVALFNAGYYWEAHEVWEELWHACGRRGTTADVLRALIKLAAAGVKVRERQEHGVRTHARRAAELLVSAKECGDARLLGLDLAYLIERALDVATSPPRDPGPLQAPVTRVFPFQITLN